MQPRYLLIADEHLSHVNYLVQHLLNRGHRIETAELGASAASAIVRRRAAGTPYDLAILDLNLPQMDAVSIARDLRARGDPTPLIIHASGARADLGLTRLLAGLRLVSVYDRPLDLSLVDAELSAVVAHQSAPPTVPQTPGRGQQDPFFGTARVQRALDESGPRPAVYSESNLPSPGTQALERRSPGPDPRPASVGGAARPPGTASVQPQARPTDPIPPSSRLNRGSYRTPVGLPATASTTRIRRSATGSIIAPPAGAATPADPNASRVVACAYCTAHFQVPVKVETYQTPCVHCGKMNLINPL